MPTLREKALLFSWFMLWSMRSAAGMVWDMIVHKIKGGRRG